MLALVVVMRVSGGHPVHAGPPVRPVSGGPPVRPVSAPASQAEASVISIRVLARARPVAIELTGPRRLQVGARGDRLVVAGPPTAGPAAAGPLELPVGDWKVRVLEGRGARAGTTAWLRRYPGRLSVSAKAGELILVLSLPLETYVALVAASETEPNTPLEVLRAQTVVTRSYARASGRRHLEADACDMAHCQVLAGAPPSVHIERARRAARDTEGVVLRLADGRVAETPFHAACGGHTADPLEHLGADERTGAAAVPDPGCPAVSWRARISSQPVEAAAGEALSRGPQTVRAPRLADLEFEAGKGGYLVRVIDRPRGLAGSGERFVSALGSRAGWGEIRGNRMRLTARGDVVLIEGSSLGHGLGLCQAGSLRMARQGRAWRDILRHYFPRATFSVDPARPVR